jgi:hypothetical protein
MCNFAGSTAHMRTSRVLECVRGMAAEGLACPRISASSLDKVYVNGCLRYNSKLNVDPRSLLNLLFPLRHLFT